MCEENIMWAIVTVGRIKVEDIQNETLHSIVASTMFLNCAVCTEFKIMMREAFANNLNTSLKQCIIDLHLKVCHACIIFSSCN